MTLRRAIVTVPKTKKVVSDNSKKTKITRAIFVEQVDNKDFDSKKPKHPETNYPYRYRVKRAMNTMTVAVGDLIENGTLQTLIYAGISVQIS